MPRATGGEKVPAHRLHSGVAALLLVALLGVGVASFSAAHASPAPQRNSVRSAAPIASLSGFVANHGQWPAEVLYFARHRGVEATVLQDALVLRPIADLERPDAPWPAPVVLRFPAARVVQGEGLLPTRHHFVFGVAQARDVPGFAQVALHDVIAGIDLVLRKGADGFAYDVHAAPGTDLDALVLEVEGATALRHAAPDVLVLETPAGPIEQRVGASWQVEPDTGARRAVPGTFREVNDATGRLRYGVAVEGRDVSRPLVIDPSLVWATYVGGTSQELLADMVVAPDGAVVLTSKASGSTPTTPGAFKLTSSGTSDAWVGKLSADGSTLVWGTFLGGMLAETPFGGHLDADGTVVVAGDTWSTDFPTTPGSVQPVIGGTPNSDVFVARLAADGSGLVWATYYGGPSLDPVSASMLLPSGDVVIAFDPGTPTPPATPGAFETEWTTASQTAVACLSADGASVVFQTYLGSAGPRAMTHDADGNILLTGTAVAGLSTTPGAFQPEFTVGVSGSDGFVAALGPAGATLLFATYLGGGASEVPQSIAVDAAGAVYVTGTTQSAGFPVTPGAFNTTTSGGFVAKLLPGGTGLVWSTFLSLCCGGGVLTLWDIAVDGSGNALVVGSSNASGFPITPDAYQPTFIGSTPSADAHLTKLDAFGEALVYSTYFGGSGTENWLEVAWLADDWVYLATRSSSGNIAIPEGAFDPTYNGSTDIVVAVFELPLLPWTVLGGGLKGSLDDPNLAGGGPLTPGSTTRLSLRGAIPSSPANLVAGLAAINAPFKGGTLVPEPLVLLPLATDSQGALDLLFPWPAVPAGIDFHVQTWVQDAGGPKGLSASNALRFTTQ